MSQGNEVHLQESSARSESLTMRLRDFQATNAITTKGPLSVVTQLTEILETKPSPWSSADFVSGSKGQVAGLGGPRLKRILARHGIERKLAAEGGRTNRGSLELMSKYIDFMNQLEADSLLKFDAVADFWAGEVKTYFEHLPLSLPSDDSTSVTSSFDQLFEQVRQRQAEVAGAKYLGSVIQHLVGAKLSLVLAGRDFESHGSAVADAPTGRGGDFAVSGTVIHCTTAPSDALIEKCRENLASGLRPVIITLLQRVGTARDLAFDAGIADRIEVWDVQQFLTTSIFDHSSFAPGGRSAAIALIIDRYNELVTVENDPSLRIEFSGTEAV